MASNTSAPAMAFDGFTLDTKLPATARGLYCNQGGDVSLTDERGTTKVFTVSAGQLLPVQYTRINTAGTTVPTPTTSLIVLY